MAEMPQTHGAIRKLGADKRKAAINAKTREGYKLTVSQLRKKPTTARLREVFKAVDRASKSGVIHKNKAARLKSRLSRLVKKK